MFEKIRADMLRAHHQSTAPRAVDVLRLLWRDNGLQSLVIYRFGRWLCRLRKRPWGWMITPLLYPVYGMLSVCFRKVSGICLEQSADIAPGLYIGHFGGIEVKNCRIGPDCSIHHQVRLGPEESTVPGLVIGKGVWIGAHARIGAGVSVGDGATIGAGAVVTRDIPQRCLVLGNPCRIACRDYDNSRYLRLCHPPADSESTTPADVAVPAATEPVSQTDHKE